MNKIPQNMYNKTPTSHTFNESIESHISKGIQYRIFSNEFKVFPEVCEHTEKSSLINQSLKQTKQNLSRVSTHKRIGAYINNK